MAVKGGGAVETVINGETGFLVDSHLDIEQIASKIYGLLVDRERTAQMGERARSHAQNFTWEAQTRHLLDLISEVVAVKRVSLTRQG